MSELTKSQRRRAERRLAVERRAAGIFEPRRSSSGQIRSLMAETVEEMQMQRRLHADAVRAVPFANMEEVDEPMTPARAERLGSKAHWLPELAVVVREARRQQR